MPQCRRDQTRFAQLLLAIVIVESVLVIIVMTWEHQDAERAAEEKRQLQKKMEKDSFDRHDMGKETIIPNSVTDHPKMDFWSDGNHRKRKATAAQNNFNKLEEYQAQLFMDARIKAFDADSYKARLALEAVPYEFIEESSRRIWGKNDGKEDFLNAEQSNHFAARKGIGNDVKKTTKGSFLLGILRGSNNREINSNLRDKRANWRSSML